MNMLLLFLLLSGSIFLTALFNKKMDVTLPVWAFIIITILYISSLVHAVSIGIYIVIISGVASAAVGIVLLIRQKKHLLELLTPGLMVFIILFFISWWSSRYLLFTRWDEYSHWGLIIKNIKMLNGLSGHPDAFVTFKDYPPAVSLFESFFMFFSKGFSEGSVYHGMHMLYFMMALPLFQHIQWKHYFKLILTTILVLMMPTVFIKDFYTIVYVDAIMGVMFAYLLLNYFFSRQDIFRAVNLGLVFFVLVLTKPAGIGLAIIALIIIFADILVEKIKSKTPWRQKASDLKTIGVSIAGIAIAKISWVIYLNVTVGARQGSEAIASFGVHRELMTHIDTGRLNVIFENFSKYITRFREFASIDLSFIGSFAAMLLLAVIIGRVVVKKHDLRRYKVMTIGVFVGFIVYVVCMLITYYLAFSEYCISILASVDRYTATYLIGILVYLIGIWIISEQKQSAKKKCFKSTILILLLLVITNFSPVLNFTLMAPVKARESMATRANYQSVVQIKDVVGEDDVYFLSIGDDGLDYMACKYLLAPVNISPENSWSVGLKPYNDCDVWTRELTPEKWAAELSYTYEYVYVYRSHDAFAQTYGQLFEGGAEGIHDKTLYRVAHISDAIVLRPVSP